MSQYVWLPLQALLDSIAGSAGEQQQQAGGNGQSVLQQLPKWLSSARQDLERALARVAAGTAAPAEAVGLWSMLAQVKSYQAFLQAGVVFVLMMQIAGWLPHGCKPTAMASWLVRHAQGPLSSYNLCTYSPR